MKNIIYIFVVVVCVGLIAFGLMREKTPSTEPIAAVGQTGTTNTAPKTQATAVSVAIGHVAQHFRPDTATPIAGTNDSATADETAERNFQLTPDLLAKMYLVDTYKPGTCYGSPVAVPQIAVTNLVAANPPLANFLKQKYDLKTDLEIYNKLKQLQGITLTETASSKFNFTFMDGQCQTVIYYEGAVAVSTNSVSAIVTSQTSHTYQ